MTTIKSKKLSLFERLIFESITAFPNDAHQKILEYLTEAGIDEDQIRKFRQAWSKVALGSQAFGKSSKTIPHPEIFSDDLVRELTFADKKIAELVDSTAYVINSNSFDTKLEPQVTQGIPDIEFLDSLSAFNSLGSNLSNIQEQMYPLAEISVYGESPHSFEVITKHRKAFRGTKISWRSSGDNIISSFIPIDLQIHGFPSLRTGLLETQYGTELQQLPPLMSTTSLCGVEVMNKLAVHQERAWNAYLVLNELVVTQSLNMFPLPVGAHRHSTHLSVVLAFEEVTVKRFEKLQGAALSTYLRKYPIIVQVWCSQLSIALRTLMSCAVGSLMRPLKVNRDFFVRNNGLLIVGNTAFDGTLPHYKPNYELEFLWVACNLLSAALCVSRREVLRLLPPQESPARDHDHDFNPSPNQRAMSELDSMTGGEPSVDFDLKNSPRSHGESFPALQETILSVVAGSTLNLEIVGHQCTRTKIEYIESNKQTVNNSRNFNSNISANGADHFHNTYDAISQMQVRILSANTSSSKVGSSLKETIHVKEQTSGVSTLAELESRSSTSMSLLVKTNRPGLVTMHLSALITDEDASSFISMLGPNSSTHDRGTLRHRERVIRIVIVPHYPIMSVALQDLVGHLEEVFTHNDPRMLLHSHLFRALSSVGPSDTTVRTAGSPGEASGLNTSKSFDGRPAVDMLELANSWKEVTKAMASFQALNRMEAV